jgi:hypothetical protein
VALLIVIAPPLPETIPKKVLAVIFNVIMGADNQKSELLIDMGKRIQHLAGGQGTSRALGIAPFRPQ